ncbi:hypothetical protein NLG97_g1955 [Lecanicillium saksenae]|uniref:Uncharacterized protein n=1 Tax=Lecanicillium saksenae TaxID=468837 RepID=A0ACC1R455_9HYPO|nr:hypothetical protein NLG97_g1955 [Lecanicillium saksenae]
MDFQSGDLLWDDLNQIAANDLAKQQARSSMWSQAQPESDQSQVIGRLPHLRSCDVDSGRDYDRNYPTGFHYDHILQRGAGKKTSKQVYLLQKTKSPLHQSTSGETSLKRM